MVNHQTPHSTPSQHAYWLTQVPGQQKFVILHQTEDVRGYDIHRGRHTGQPVIFSRLADANRLCRLLNRQQKES